MGFEILVFTNARRRKKMDRILWNYLEALPEQEAAWKEWSFRLTNWHRFNIFYT